MAKIFRYAILRQNIDEFKQICNLDNSNGQKVQKIVDTCYLMLKSCM